MSLTLTGTKTAVGLGNTASFLATGGTAPYAYVVLPNGQGGTIDGATGLYSSPPYSSYNPSPSNATDTIQVIDSTGATATATILVGPPMILFLDILSTVLQLPAGRCLLYDTKGFQPTDAGLYIVVGMGHPHVFGNNKKYDSTTDTYVNSVNVVATLDLHVISVDTSALWQKELVLAALMSPYSISQQEANAFSIGRVPLAGQFNDLSEVDGPAIPYHFQISINLTYAVDASYPTPVFTEFQGVTETINP